MILTDRAGNGVHVRDDLAMRMYVVYEKPSDFPDVFVLRGHTVDLATGKSYPDLDPPYVATTVEMLRRAIPGGKVCIGRYPNDDPVIVEVWI